MQNLGFYSMKQDIYQEDAHLNHSKPLGKENQGGNQLTKVHLTWKITIKTVLE